MKQFANLVRAVAKPLRNSREDYEQLLDWVGDVRFVLLGAPRLTARTSSIAEERKSPGA